MKKIIISFRLTDPNFELFVQKVTGKMTGNANFPTPNPTLKVIAGNLSDYSDALAIAGRNQPKENNILKNQARTTLEGSMKQLAAYIMDTAAGDEAMLASSGFTLYKDRQKKGEFPKIKTITAVPWPNKGSIKITVNKIEGAKFYEFQYAPVVQNADPVWQSVQGTKKVKVITGLTSGTEYQIRVAAAGATDARVWSNIVTTYVL
jgi:hypothetical protein